MPLPLAVGSLTLAASKQALVQAAASVSSYEVGVASTTAATAYVLARLAWNRIPSWIKDDVSFQNLIRNEKGRLVEPNTGADAADNMSNTLTSIVEKVHLLLQSAGHRLQNFHDDDVPVPNLYASLILYMQLAAQLNRRFPGRLIHMYNNTDPSATGETFVVDKRELREAFQWAMWAYEPKLETLQSNFGTEFAVKQHTTSAPARPCNVGHFVAISKSRKLVVVGVKGTSTLEDLLTDCCGRSIPYIHNISSEPAIEVSAERPDIVGVSDEEIEVTSGHERIWMQANGDHEVRCHEGILLSATKLANDVAGLVENYVVRNRYRCVVCGHSLGAGAASLLAVVLRSRFPTLAQNDAALQVYAFAPPPVLDLDSALLASPYVLSIVNNADIVPRCSLANLLVFLEFLRLVNQKVEERGLHLMQPFATAALIRKVLKGADDDDLLMTAEEVEQARNAAYKKIHLQHPVSVVSPCHQHLKSRFLTQPRRTTCTSRAVSWFCWSVPLVHTWTWQRHLLDVRKRLLDLAFCTRTAPPKCCGSLISMASIF